MRRGGRGWLAVAMAAIVVSGALVAARIGPATPAAATPGSAASTTWLCPHGGGPGWTAQIEIANPGGSPVQAQVTSYGKGPSADIDDVADIDVPAHGEVLHDMPAPVRAAATRVDVFGGWAAVGWTAWASGKEAGLSAEPCTSTPGSSWSVVDGVTNQRTRSFLVVMNPFASDAVIDVALFVPDRPPVRSADWTDLPIDAGTCIALDLGAKRSGALGESIVGAEVTATVGRVAVSSLAVQQGGGIRSVLAAPSLSNRWILPATAGSGSGVVSLLVPQVTPIRYGGTALSEADGAETAGDLPEARQAGTSSASSKVQTLGPSAVIVDVTEGGPIGAALREEGRKADQGAAGGTPTSATAWVVLPTAFGIEPRPSLVLVNDGDQPVTASVTLLHEGGGSIGDTVQVTVPVGRTVGVPGMFLREDHAAAALVTADGPIVALGAGTAGSGDDTRYAMAMGVPIPSGQVPTAA
jgi:hypothetical protein